MNFSPKLLPFFLFCLITSSAITQRTGNDTIVVAGNEYQKPSSYQKLFGKNRRAEWTTPVRVKILLLDSVGLTPYAQGGGNETRSLRLKTKEGKQYSLRSINKSRDEVIAPEFRGTFIEDIIRDGVSMSHPYGAFALDEMQQAAGIYHALPQLVYLPRQIALDSFNNKFGDDLYLFEQRTDGDWSEASHLGNFNEFYNTSEVQEKLLQSNNYKADQKAFLKARLLDMLIADWDRHEDNWKWGFDSTHRLFEPIPKDRDQAFYTHNGFLIDRLLPATGLGFMQNFDFSVKNIATLNWEERNFDRLFTNELDLNNWLNTAKELQAALTDSVITRSVRQLPPEIFAVSGEELIAKLKSRVNELPSFAKEYYLFLSKEVEVPASAQAEYFELTGGDKEVRLQIFSSRDQRKDTLPFYSRVFNSDETKELRVFGIDGNDVYRIDQNSSNIKIRIIGGPAKDSVIHTSNSRIHYYDDADNYVLNKNIRLHLSNDSNVHLYEYSDHPYDKKGVSPTIDYNDADRTSIGIAYGITNYKWRKQPYGMKAKFSVNYSIDQKAFSSTINTIFPKAVGKWDLLLSGNYDAIRWTNFYGYGNNSSLTTEDRDFNRMRSEEWLAKVSFQQVKSHHTFTISPLFQSVRIINDTARYLFKQTALPINNIFHSNNYTALQLSYSFLNINDSILPTNGFSLLTNAGIYQNLTQQQTFEKFSIRMQAYIPLVSKFSLLIRTGGEAVTGNTSSNDVQLLQHAVVGGASTLRGYHSQRFWGNRSFYNNNELRFITNVRTYFMNAKAGLFVFFDNGRVWIPDDSSNTFHTSYGYGLIGVPFNKLAIIISYGISAEERLIQIRFNKLF